MSKLVYSPGLGLVQGPLYVQVSLPGLGLVQGPLYVQVSL